MHLDFIRNVSITKQRINETFHETIYQNIAPNIYIFWKV